MFAMPLLSWSPPSDPGGGVINFHFLPPSSEGMGGCRFSRGV
jgi:hypothetical protein